MEPDLKTYDGEHEEGKRYWFIEMEIRQDPTRARWTSACYDKPPEVIIEMTRAIGTPWARVTYAREISFEELSAWRTLRNARQVADEMRVKQPTPPDAEDTR